MIEAESSCSGTTKPATAVMAIAITIGAPTSPADTAASPIISAPTMLIACPTGLGSLTPASRSISNDRIRIKAKECRERGALSGRRYGEQQGCGN